MSDTKHGWVSPRADGLRARCGGPGLCTTCNTEREHEAMCTAVRATPQIPTHASYLADVARAAHQTGKDLTLEEVAAVIEAVNALGAADDTVARTGNTARDQEMYAAGRAVGEENAKHNAAVRGGVPDGWKLLAKKTCYMLMHDGDVIATLAGPDSKENAAIIASMLAAPASPVSTVEQDPPAAYLTLDEEGSPCMLFFDVVEARTYCEVGEEPEPLYRRPAPAAGDAQTDAAPEWATCESRGPWARNSLKAVIDLLRGKETRARHAFTKDYMGLPARYIADAYGEAAAVVELKLAAIAAQRQGDA